MGEILTWSFLALTIIQPVDPRFATDFRLLVSEVSMGICGNGNGRSELLGWQMFGASKPWPLTIVFLTVALGSPARPQEPPHPAGSVVEAARNARERKTNSTNHAKVFTNDELGRSYSAPSALAAPPRSASTNGAEASKPPAAGCDNSDAERLKAELQGVQGEQDQVRRETSNNPIAFSGGTVDMKNFKPGSSGVALGGPPLIETKPPIPARVEEVSLDEKIASLTRALRIACAPPEDGAIQAKLDQADRELSVLRRQFNLDQGDYYSKTNFATDTSGKIRLDAEQQQIQELQSEIERLKAELAASKTNPPVQ